MAEETKIQSWYKRLKTDCNDIGESPNWSHADMRYFGHIHDLADCGYARAEEVAGSISTLSEQMNRHQTLFQEFVDKNFAQVMRETAEENLDFSSSKIISRKRLEGELQEAYSKAYGDPFGETWMGPRRVAGIAAVLRALGYEVEE